MSIRFGISGDWDAPCSPKEKKILFFQKKSYTYNKQKNMKFYSHRRNARLGRRGARKSNAYKVSRGGIRL